MTWILSAGMPSVASMSRREHSETAMIGVGSLRRLRDERRVHLARFAPAVLGQDERDDVVDGHDGRGRCGVCGAAKYGQWSTSSRSLRAAQGRPACSHQSFSKFLPEPRHLRPDLDVAEAVGREVGKPHLVGLAEARAEQHVLVALVVGVKPFEQVVEVLPDPTAGFWRKSALIPIRM
jgi:hypothetical protein